MIKSDSYQLTPVTHLQNQSYLPFKPQEVVAELRVLREALFGAVPATVISDSLSDSSTVSDWIQIAHVLVELVPHSVGCSEKQYQQVKEKLSGAELQGLQQRMLQLEKVLSGQSLLAAKAVQLSEVHKTVYQKADLKLGSLELSETHKTDYLVVWLPVVPGDRWLQLIGFADLPLGLVWSRHD